MMRGSTPPQLHWGGAWMQMPELSICRGCLPVVPPQVVIRIMS